MALMAITKNMETTDGVSHPDAYAVISQVTVDWVKGTAKVSTQIFHSKETFEAKKNAIWTYNYRFGPDSGAMPAFASVFGNSVSNFMEPLIASIKALPEWEGWVDTE